MKRNLSDDEKLENHMYERIRESYYKKQDDHIHN
jgi:hypothetical protein